jgi:hypothetical protein
MINFFDFWELILSPGFLIGFGLTAAPLAVLAYSVWGTWEENGVKMARRRRRR